MPKNSIIFYEIGLVVSGNKKAFNISKPIANKSFFFPKKIRRIAITSTSNIQLEVVERKKCKLTTLLHLNLSSSFLCIFSIGEEK